MITIFLCFRYQKWFEYEARVSFMPNGWAASAGGRRRVEFAGGQGRIAFCGARETP
jgi:hypothetical protein